jgi:hypothetical protein
MKSIDLNIPETAAERAAATPPPPAAERILLLTVARLLRAHMSDHMHHPDFSDIDQDWADLNEALKPFDAHEGLPLSSVIGEREDRIDSDDGLF